MLSLFIAHPELKPFVDDNKCLGERFRLRCPTCETAFCTKCNARPYHLGMDCATAALQASAPTCRFCEAEIFVGSLDTVVVHAHKVKCNLDVPLAEDSDEEELVAALSNEIDKEILALAQKEESIGGKVKSIDQFESKYDEGQREPPSSLASPFAFSQTSAAAMGIGLNLVDGNRIKILADRKRRRRKRPLCQSKMEEQREPEEKRDVEEKEVAIEGKARDEKDLGKDLALVAAKGAQAEKVIEETPSESCLYICRAQSCRRKLPRACLLTLDCGHRCFGVRGEALVESPRCCPCLVRECVDKRGGNQDEDDFCQICWSSRLGASPCIELE